MGHYLVLDGALLQLGLEKHLQSNNKLRLFLSGQVYISKLSFAKGSANVEVCQSPTVILSSFRVTFSVRIDLLGILDQIIKLEVTLVRSKILTHKSFKYHLMSKVTAKYSKSKINRANRLELYFY
jgi:hypothetical protein